MYCSIRLKKIIRHWLLSLVGSIPYKCLIGCGSWGGGMDTRNSASLVQDMISTISSVICLGLALIIMRAVIHVNWEDIASKDRKDIDSV
jgi:hypothetical protein